MRRVVILTLALAGVVVLAVVSLGASGGGERTIEAEFASARGLVPGNDVRINGAPAGSVSGMELTDNGTALVTIELHDGIDPPRADASAAIRPVDLIGDNYVALDPGRDDAELDTAIPTSRTLDVPRLDDLLRSFGDSERTALKVLLVEGGVALDDRGEDLNRTALALRPALQAADDVTGELGSQSAQLRSFITDAERVTRQAADRGKDLGRAVGALDATLHATADNSDSLDATLAGLPGTLDDLDAVAGRLDGTARAATPLSDSVRRAAPGLSEAAGKAEPFLRSVGEAAGKLHPTLQLAGRTLQRSKPTFDALDSGLGDVIASNGDLRDFADVLVPAAPAISQGFFVNFPDQAAEPGKQPFDPFADPRRHYWRGAAVLTCQSFGVPIKPGCLTDFVSRILPKPSSGDGAKGKDSKGGKEAGGNASSGNGAAPGSGSTAAGDEGSPGAPDSGLPLPGNDLPLPGSGASSGSSQAAAPSPVSDLLDFIFGP
jgi:virulence factor Mce-like protein